jgi:glycosyl transferase, family 25
MSLNLFEKIIYINLPHRKDRENSLLKELERLQVKKDKIIKITAHNDPLNGTRGCAISHLEALKTAIELNLDNVLILEDDCIFPRKVSFINKTIAEVLKHLQNDWDAICLGGLILKYKDTKHSFIKRICYSECAHAYVVNKHYLPMLYCCFKTAYDSMKNDVFYSQSRNKAIDCHWKVLQLHDRWFVPTDIVAQQSESFSDIELRYKDRTHSIKD